MPIGEDLQSPNLTSRKAGKCSPSRCPGRRKYWGKHRMLSLPRLSWWCLPDSWGAPPSLPYSWQKGRSWSSLLCSLASPLFSPVQSSRERGTDCSVHRLSQCLPKAQKLDALCCGKSHIAQEIESPYSLLFDFQEDNFCMRSLTWQFSAFLSQSCPLWFSPGVEGEEVQVPSRYFWHWGEFSFMENGRLFLFCYSTKSWVTVK